MQLLNFGLDLERTCKSNGYITDGDRHCVAIHEDQPSLLVDD